VSSSPASTGVIPPSQHAQAHRCVPQHATGVHHNRNAGPLCTERTLSFRPRTLSFSHLQTSPQQQEQRRQNGYTGVPKTKGGRQQAALAQICRSIQRPAAAVSGPKQHLTTPLQQQTGRVQPSPGRQPARNSGLPPTTSPPSQRSDVHALLPPAGLKPFNSKSVFSASRSVKVCAVSRAVRCGAASLAPWLSDLSHPAAATQPLSTPQPEAHHAPHSTQFNHHPTTSCAQPVARAHLAQPHTRAAHPACPRRCLLPAAAALLLLQFHVRYKCEFGQEVYLVGNCDALGDWDVMRGVQLVWSPGHIWEGSVELPAG
jgi:hypothetical protein